MKEMKTIGISLAIFSIIMLAVVLLYRDFLITLTAAFIVAVLAFQYFAPILREKAQQKRDADARKKEDSG